MARYEVSADYFSQELEISKQTFDAVIVGGGVAGALIAYELVKAGYSVLMLEAGPDQTTIKDRNLLVENFYKASQRTPESAYPDVPAAPKATTAALYERPYNGYLDQAGSSETNIPASTSNNWFKSTYERRVGGTTWHWLGTCLRLVPNDFMMKSVYKPEASGFADWPITYTELAPWYDKAAIEMGVSGDDKYIFGVRPDLPPWIKKYGKYKLPEYPMKKILQSYSDKEVNEIIGGDTVDVTVDVEENGQVEEASLKGLLVVSPTPQARNSLPGYQQRPQCCGNSSCIPVCPIHAKYDASVHVDLCRNNYGRRFTLVSQACAHKVELDKDNLVSGVVFRKWEQDGPDIKYHDYTVTGKIFVIAAHAIETPKLLLNSKSEQMPNGVANSSGLVGKYLMDHNTQLSYAMVKDPVYSYRGPLSTSGIESLKETPARSKIGAFRIEIGNDGWEWPNNSPYTTAYNAIYGTPATSAVYGSIGGKELPPIVPAQEATSSMFGQALNQKLANNLSRQIRVAALVEPTPMLDHDVQVSDQLDALGLPRPKIRYGITDDPYCIGGMKAAIKVHQQIFMKLGAKPDEIFHHSIENFAGAGHIMGTYRMGDKPESSVVNAKQQSWDHKNLYLVGSGIFPTVGASNPTFTIGALSLWAAQNIIDQLKST